MMRALVVYLVDPPSDLKIAGSNPVVNLCIFSVQKIYVGTQCFTFGQFSQEKAISFTSIVRRFEPAADCTTVPIISV